MPLFNFKARDSNGLLVTGEREAESSQDIVNQLEDQGLIPISVASGKKSFGSDFSLSSLKDVKLFEGVKAEELILFTRQFYTLFKAGMDIESILETLGKQVKNEYFADVLGRIKNDVAAGSNLSRAFAQHPKVFSDLYCSILASGEEAGILEQSMEQLSTLLEKSHKLTQAIKAATLYPKIVVVVLIGGIVAVMLKVIPSLKSFFDSFDAELPFATRLLMGISDFFVSYWHVMFVVSAILVVAYKKWSVTPKGRAVIDKIAWKLPVFGELGKKVGNARFTNTLAALYKSGIPITRALEITASVVDHYHFGQAILSVRSDVEKGRSISDSMRNQELFNPIVVEATAIGERSGAMDDMYFSIAKHYDDEVDVMVKNLSTLLEPVLLGVVFGMVALLMFAIFMPLMGISKAALG